MGFSITLWSRISNYNIESEIKALCLRISTIRFTKVALFLKELIYDRPNGNH